jgi:hypothetical protein
MGTKRFAITYAVTFKERFCHHGVYYYPGVAYHFTDLSPSEDPPDMHKTVRIDYFRRFYQIDEKGCIVVYAASDPVIKDVREIMIPAAAGENENKNEVS